MAQLVAALNKPTLVLAPNKVLAAQLCSELAAFFPENAVRDEFCRARLLCPSEARDHPSPSLRQVSYAVSHFDYYRPESYSAVTDNYAEKISRTNDAIDALRHAATRNLFERRDTIVVATVSCIYGLGLPSAFLEGGARARGRPALGQPRRARRAARDAALRARAVRLARQPARARRVPLARDGGRRARRPTRPPTASRPVCDASLVPMHEDDDARLEIALETSDGACASPRSARTRRGRRARTARTRAPRRASAPPASPDDELAREPRVVEGAARGGRVPRAALRGLARAARARARRSAPSSSSARPRCARRARRRRRRGSSSGAADLEALEAPGGGYVRGVENYSRHFSGAAPGAPPATLLDYLPKDDWLLLVDESHLTVPQLAAMCASRRARARARALASARCRREPRHERARALLLAQVRGRREAQALAHRARLPAAVGGRQPAAHGARVLGARRRAALRLGRRPAPSSQCAATSPSRASSSCDRPPSSTRASRSSTRRPAARTTCSRSSRSARRAASAPRDVPHARSAEELAAFLSARGVRAAWLHAGVKAAERVLALDALRRGETDALVGCDLLCASASGDEAERGPRPPSLTPGPSSGTLSVRCNLLREGLDLPEREPRRGRRRRPHGLPALGDEPRADHRPRRSPRRRPRRAVRARRRRVARHG